MDFHFPSFPRSLLGVFNFIARPFQSSSTVLLDDTPPCWYGATQFLTNSTRQKSGHTWQIHTKRQYKPNGAKSSICHRSWIFRGHVLNRHRIDTPSVLVHLRQNTGWETEMTKWPNHGENVYDHMRTVDIDSTNSIGATHPVQNSALRLQWFWNIQNSHCTQDVRVGCQSGKG